MTSNNDIERETIVFSGGDEWTVEELTEFLGHVYVLYNRISVLREERRSVPTRPSRQMYASKSRVPDERKMLVDSLTIQSPMEINLKGIAEIIREAREAIKDIYRNPLERKRLEQQLEHDSTLNDIEIAKSKIDLIRDANQAMLEIGISDEERHATLKALFGPARDAATIVEKKNLKIE